jgi:Icc-related predicted phosphoesterase
MKLLALSDIHQMNSKWKSLVDVCKKEKPEVVVIAGDLLPKDGGIPNQLKFLKHLHKYARLIKSNRIRLVLVLGNDDNQNIIKDMVEGHNLGLWSYVQDKVVEINGYEFVAMPYVPDYPFGYKYWCRGEYKDNLRICSLQLGNPVLLNDRNEYETISNYSKYLQDKATIWDSLVELATKVKNIDKSIWLIHAPPANFDLDVCQRGVKVGSEAVYDFILKYQPFITVHGHIHESPECNGHKWYHKEGKTTSIQCGQLGFDLNYSVINIEKGNIVKMEHSIYGASNGNFNGTNHT